MKFVATILTLLALSYQSAFAISSYEIKKKAALEDKTISETVRKELKEYYDKSEQVYNEFKNKKKVIRDSLSEDAKKAVMKHHARVKKTDAKLINKVK